MITGCWALADPRRRLGQGGSQRRGSLSSAGRGEWRNAGHLIVDHIPRQLDVDRSLQPADRADDAVDLAQRVLGRVEDGRGDRQMLKHPVLRVVRAHLVVEQRVTPPLATLGAPLMTRTGDSSAYACPVVFVTFSPPTP